MDTILEQQRGRHEERERLIELMVNEYGTKKTAVKQSKHITPSLNS